MSYLYHMTDGITVSYLYHMTDDSGIVLRGITEDKAAQISSYLIEYRDDFGFWFELPRAEHAEATLKLFPVGESGKGYDFDRELQAFMEFAEGIEVQLDGRFYLAGEAVGDLTRYRLTSWGFDKAKASLVFDDGEVYGR